MTARERTTPQRLTAALLATAGPILAAAALAAPTAAQSARGSGSGDFVAHLDDLLPPAAERFGGIQNPAISAASIAIYDDDAPDGGLYRFNVRMDILPGRGEEAAARARVGRDAGMNVLMTCAGTPRWNASGWPPGEPWWPLPPYARSAPADPHAWAQDLVDLLSQMAALGSLPDRIEIWNEPDREEWWAGSREQFLRLFGIAAATVKAAFPEIEVGGPGLAAPTSAMGGEESLLLDLVDQAAQLGHPLDFLSWHNYDIASAMRYHGVAAALRDRLAATGLAGTALLVSEFNIYPGVQGNPHRHEFDGSHAAAQLVGVLAAVVDLDLQGSVFFMVQDAENASAVLDLTGAGQGVLSRRGVKKPVFRVLELLSEMAPEPRVRVDYPEDEYAVSVIAARHGKRLRFVAGNDVVPAQWVWSNGCRERGAEPGRLYDATEALRRAGLPVTYENLLAQGLAPWEAEVVLEVLPLAREADGIARRPRELRIVLQGAGEPQPVQAWRFDAEHNAPARHREALLPTLEWIEWEARRLAYDAAAALLAANGVIVPPFDPEATYPTTPKQLSILLGINIHLAEAVMNLYNDTLEEERLAHVDSLNALPETALRSCSLEEAGVQLEPGGATLTLEPNAVVVFDINLRGGLY